MPKEKDMVDFMLYLLSAGNFVQEQSIPTHKDRLYNTFGKTFLRGIKSLSVLSGAAADALAAQRNREEVKQKPEEEKITPRIQYTPQVVEKEPRPAPSYDYSPPEKMTIPDTQKEEPVPVRPQKPFVRVRKHNRDESRKKTTDTTSETFDATENEEQQITAVQSPPQDDVQKKPAAEVPQEQFYKIKENEAENNDREPAISGETFEKIREEEKEKLKEKYPHLQDKDWNRGLWKTWLDLAVKNRIDEMKAKS